MTESILPVEESAAKPKSWVRNPLRRKNLRLRVLGPVALGLAVLLTADPSTPGLLLGLPLIAAGLWLRAWATGHLVKTREFTVSGPYAYLRHPLYAGTLLIGVGFCSVAGGRLAPFVLAAFLAFFFAYYFPRKERIEAERLESLYGEQFRRYRAAVRALLPSLRPWTLPGSAPAARPRWRFERFRDNDELGTEVVVVLALAVLYVVATL